MQQFSALNHFFLFCLFESAASTRAYEQQKFLAESSQFFSSQLISSPSMPNGPEARRGLCLDTPAPLPEEWRAWCESAAGRSHDCVCSVCLTPAEWTEAF